MAYLIDRQRALRDVDIVAVVTLAQRGARSRVILSDNSLYQTRTRPQTLRRQAQDTVQGGRWRKRS